MGDTYQSELVGPCLKKRIFYGIRRFEIVLAKILRKTSKKKHTQSTPFVCNLYESTMSMKNVSIFHTNFLRIV